ncbi:class I SAM-dependent DNA methyltransferase [Pseudactinotalea suaedae]|uniref:class I SAM-dependent DNA methyltransferase n=1 Tax=Pseudactinotalea suaedae TaxID=1524924 RepID=UPI0012E29A1B|nr:class I SAM-dependent DNA methyltransferase [Pseudactinotalea suaedae]
MAASDAIVVGESWISEHFMTTDSRKESFRAKVLERRKVWDEARAEGHDSTRQRYLDARRDLLSALSTLTEDGEQAELPALYERLREVLGYTRIGLSQERHGPVVALSTAGLTGAAPLVIVEAVAVSEVDDLLAKDAATLLTPYDVDEKTRIVSVARLLSHLFVDDDAPAFALVLAGGVALVAERTRWPEGRYLAVDMQLVAERADDTRGGETDTALTCLDAASLAPDAEGAIWWTGTLEESIKHTVGVSKDLREGVRLSIEIIANEVVLRRRAQGLAPLPQSEAQPLAKQSLRFLYRILFLLYAEASPELGVLPSGVPAYEAGYSLDRLRDLVQVELASPRKQSGTHLYASLAALFRLVDEGHDGGAHEGDDGTIGDGLTFRALRADLFEHRATAHIDEVGLGNAALQQVLQHLLLSKASRGKDRGFISYAELGINQLGAVYEGLMSYTGFFAEDDLYEVAKGGDSEKGSWVVPTHRADSIDEKDFVRTEDPVTGEPKRVLHRRGTFVFRLSGRERQQSASYYTPEVLTRFTVGQALEELLDQDDTTTPARDILDLTVCEPALGSGAFAIEAVRQLAEQYLRRRQEELGQRIDPDDYPRELQKVKAYLALHNVYGVDLNATAVELAEISLWLDTMGEGLKAPWFGLHLKRGNSLIGCRRTTFRRDQVADKSWLKAIPTDQPLDGESFSGIHHFLLPARGWGSSEELNEARVIADLNPESRAALKTWRRNVQQRPSKKQVEQLASLANRAERLWDFALRRLTIAEQQIRRPIEVWGAEDLPVGGTVTREEIEESLADARGAYRRLRTVMDAWNALWFWPLNGELTTQTTVCEDGESQVERIDPPTLEQWIDAVRGLLGWQGDGASTGSGRKWRGGDETLASGADWAELGVAEETDLGFAGALNPEAVRKTHPWLDVCATVAEQQGFFHWELDFAPVFARRGGFDLQLGNPPWVRPRTDLNALLAENDPWWQLTIRPPQSEVRAKLESALARPAGAAIVIEGIASMSATISFLGARPNYPRLDGLQPDLYRCFMEATWRHRSRHGAIGLIHPESHFTDERARLLRASAYERLRRHWHFVNELVLFEVDHHNNYGVHIYASPRQPSFLQATSLYHPETAVRSLVHDGTGEEPGLKDPAGNWDVRPHSRRIMNVDIGVLSVWHSVLETAPIPVSQSRMVYAVNRSTSMVVEKLARAGRVGDFFFSEGWHESRDRRAGYIATEWGAPNSWMDAIVQGPHIHVATPFYKQPNKTMLHNLDWSVTDFEALAPTAIPITQYKPGGARSRYDAAYTHWKQSVDTDDPADAEGLRQEAETVSARDFYRIAWRNMAANSGERTFTPALIPPGAAHIHGVSSLALPSQQGKTAVIAGFAASLVHDFAVRVAPKSTISATTVGRLPYVDAALSGEVVLRALRLNALTEVYARLWTDCFDADFRRDSWTCVPERSGWADLGDVGPEWTPDTPLRVAEDRRQALLEIDALVALSLGLTADELCTIYRTQFPVLYGYDRNTYFYDENGRLVPNSVLSVWRKKGDAITEEERTAVHPGSGIAYTYELPFVTLDREADMRKAYAVFEQRLKG